MIELFLVSLLSLVGYQLVGVAIFLPVELAFPRERMRLAERAGGLIFLLAGAMVAAAAAVAAASLRPVLGIHPVALHTTAGGPLLAAVCLALWVDFQFYVSHRIEHRFLWRFHQVHHSIRHLSAANSYHHWTEPLWLATIGLPLLFVDVAIGPTLGLLTLLFRVQQFYIHSSTRPHFGPLRRLLIDNRYHRIHHSVEPAHHHKNFGAMTPLWDWLFGTMYQPAAHEWPAVGLADVTPPDSLADWLKIPPLRDGPQPRLASGPGGGRGEVLLDRDRSADTVLIP